MISFKQEAEEVPNNSLYAKIHNTIKNSNKVQAALAFSLLIAVTGSIIALSVDEKKHYKIAIAFIAVAVIVGCLAINVEFCARKKKVKLKSSLEFTIDNPPTEKTPFLSSQASSSQERDSEIVVAP